MALARIRLAKDVTLAGTATFDTGIIDVRVPDVLEAIHVKVTSVAGAPDVKIEYAISPDGTNFGGFEDYTDILSSSATVFTTNPEGWHAVALPNVLSRWIKFRFTGLAGNQQDTILNAYMFTREPIALV